MDKRTKIRYIVGFVIGCLGTLYIFNELTIVSIVTSLLVGVGVSFFYGKYGRVTF